ncbi:hypothetical protein [uncultured Nostoc sp.]
MYSNALTLQRDASLMHLDVLALQGDALALQGIAKFNPLQINKMLYLTA